MTCNIQSTIYDKVLIKQTKNQYLRFCRSKTDCQSRIYCLLEAVCLTFNSTRPPPVTVYPLQVKFESIIIFNAQNSAFYTDFLVRNWPVSFIGQELTCFFYWPQTGPCFCVDITSFIVFGQELAHAFVLILHQFVLTYVLIIR